MTDIDRVWQYWLEPKPQTAEEIAQRSAQWFGGSADQDRQIRVQFGHLVEQARNGELASWASTPRGRLALIILIDQFSRHVYRGAPQAYSADAKALQLAIEGHESGAFAHLDSLEQVFAYLPFSHAEQLPMQKRAVELAQRAAMAAPEVWRETLFGAVDFARKHLDVIARFGRFPHRNLVLNQTNTAEESAYLDYLRVAGQWL
jgi:uncharacterized protein (DUF924 family)